MIQNKNGKLKLLSQNINLIRVVVVISIILAIFIQDIGKRKSIWDLYRYSVMASQESPKYIYINKKNEYFGVYGANTEESIDYMIHFYKSFRLSDSMPDYSCPRHQYIAPFTKFEVLETLSEDSLVVLRWYINSPRLAKHNTLFVPLFCVHDTLPTGVTSK